ncbi:beta-agarase [Labilibaculum filiforme]|uniref:Beta-agarase n=1 Tax=Labilibaculum filiforme TaxID=1940526 RepID=A0A2N3HUX8_9BACT|nr:T9SS type A sorting domain-containing protein [Labilibaculum filiforme]PKQ61860.1 beta-agarase [Labilibaculum filiforme]
MKKFELWLVFFFIVFNAFTQDWIDIAVPASPENGKAWELQLDVSDDFNYQFDAASVQTTFGDKWTNFYHNSWNGPGTTYWQYDHVSVNGSELVIKASRNSSTSKMGVPGVNAGCVTSSNRVKYPVFIESKVSVADIVLASDFWLLSPDDTQEIDIIECYGGADQGNEYFSKFIHLSHHSFVRDPFQDYQPRDKSTWWEKAGVTSWGEYCWNKGDRKYVRVGVNWISPVHFEYYIDGELVRVLYDKAFASKIGNLWYYTYPSMTNGELDMENGYQKANAYSSDSEYSFETLKKASDVSNTSAIDPYNFQGGEGFTKELDIIINIESQDWHVSAGRTPSDADLNNPAKNSMKVDWVRVYKPVEIPTAIYDMKSQDIKVYPNPTKGDFTLTFPTTFKDQKMELYNLLGQKLMSDNVSGTSHTVQLKDVPKGMYLLVMEKDGVKFQEKILVN